MSAAPLRLSHAFRHPSRCVVGVWVGSAVALLASLFFWVAFPFVYRAVVHAQLRLSQDADGQLSKVTFFWSKPPLQNLMKFYMFNVTNIDQVTFYGAKPVLLEVGPFAIWETEEKSEFQFNEDQTAVWYKNFKRYVYSAEHSCPECSYDALISMVNLPATGALTELTNPKYAVAEWFQEFLAFGVLLLGEHSFVQVSFGDVVFDGYNDALLSAAHSDALHFVSKLLHQEHFNQSTFIPVPVPTMERLGFFFHYNNTNDEDFWIDTGKKNVHDIGKIITWANYSTLPESWYSTPQSRMINGTDTGTFQGPGLKKTDRLEFFMSFLCRSLYMEFEQETEVNGIPTYEYRVPPSVFDLTLPENRGMRYENFERVNYAPGWPACPSNSNAVCVDSADTDCTINNNLCNACCHGSSFNDTYLLPPGIYPVQCYPGRRQAPPFDVLFSPPHFSYSPPQIAAQMVGLESSSEYVPFRFYYEPIAGMPVRVRMQYQVNIPYFAMPHFAITAHNPVAMLPFLWIDAQGDLTQHAHAFIKLGFVTVPMIAFILKIVTLVLGVCGVLTAMLLTCRRNHRRLPVRFLSATEKY